MQKRGNIPLSKRRSRDWPLAGLIGCCIALLCACVATPMPQTPAQQACAEHYLRRAPAFRPYWPVAGAEFLRVDRYLALQADRAVDVASRRAWLAWSNGLANEALGLSAAPDCVAQILESIAQQPQRWQALQNAVGVPDEYHLSLRALGLYPLVRWPVLIGIKRELAETRATQAHFAPNPNDWRYFSAQWSRPPADVTPLVGLQAQLGLASQLVALMRTWAPSFALPMPASAANTPVAVRRDQAGRLQVAPDPATVYSYASYGEFKGRQTLQLNYQLWFAERPSRGALDMLAGRLDGLHWRVHLNEALQPIAFDAMHTCGCWYQLYPAQGYAVHPTDERWQEPVYVGRTLPPIPGQVLFLATDSHSLLSVDEMPTQVATQALALEPLLWATAGLRGQLSQAAGDYWRMFDDRGRVPESVRLERWYFWPMGIADAGSMRAPGHHAIAFAGRRHFDDPLLLERIGLR